jgi:two-component system response regulator ChvI
LQIVGMTAIAALLSGAVSVIPPLSPARPTSLCSPVQTRILLVDDDELYREVMAGDLEDRGYAVVGFADGAALLAAVQAGLEAEAVLIDWSLPQMSGLDVLRALRAQGCGLPVAFLTGRSREERAGQAMEAGAVEFIDKTCGIDVLVEKLGRIAGQARA